MWNSLLVFIYWKAWITWYSHLWESLIGSFPTRRFDWHPALCFVRFLLRAFFFLFSGFAVSLGPFSNCQFPTCRCASMHHAVRVRNGTDCCLCNKNRQQKFLILDFQSFRFMKLLRAQRNVMGAEVCYMQHWKQKTRRRFLLQVLEMHVSKFAQISFHSHLNSVVFFVMSVEFARSFLFFPEFFEKCR